MLLRPGEIGSCCLLFAQAAPNSPIRNSLGAPSHTEPEAKPSCASEGFPADQILAFGTASMKNLSLQQGSVSIFLSSTCLPFYQKMGTVLLSEKAKLGKEQRGPLMLSKAGMLHVENPWGFFLAPAEGFSIHCLHVLGIHPECCRIRENAGIRESSGKPETCSCSCPSVSMMLFPGIPWEYPAQLWCSDAPFQSHAMRCHQLFHAQLSAQGFMAKPAPSGLGHEYAAHWVRINI